ncbi:CmcJ/NvfI family oxidoreductase [Bradyrhizobium tropiciagri]|uniref:CmcJ/NvfI family oxidoreductase n=1 Tax=Bradyrhizobium tropiciagri TaxID=312253 RepID=UPI000B0E5532|nr:CmcJ/NvfI family oxidoreductase [Bradyrhizobium tropiciagri]
MGLAAVKVDRDQLDSVRAEIGFIPRTPREAKAAVEICNGYPVINHEVEVRDARPIADKLSLDREGFTLVRHRISCLDETDQKELSSRYTEEMASFIKNRFNASWVIPWVQGKQGAVILRSADHQLGEDGVRGRARVAHIDYTPTDACAVATRSERAQGMPPRAYSRLMLIQTWCATSPPPQDFPLAFVDGSTLVDTDLFVSSLNDQTREIYSKVWRLHYNPLHRWYYFSNMTKDEFVMFKGYDSEDHHNPRAAHCSFDNRLAFPNGKPRASVEARFAVYYE